MDRMRKHGGFRDDLLADCLWEGLLSPRIGKRWRFFIIKWTVLERLLRVRIGMAIGIFGNISHQNSTPKTQQAKITILAMFGGLRRVQLLGVTTQSVELR
jgi:hypothetical protein